MSKYPVVYYSESKRADVEIEAMATPHIINAWRKLTLEGGSEHAEVIRCMDNELTSRGCKLDVETGKWSIPEKP